MNAVDSFINELLAVDIEYVVGLLEEGVDPHMQLPQTVAELHELLIERADDVDAVTSYSEVLNANVRRFVGLGDTAELDQVCDQVTVAAECLRDLGKLIRRIACLMDSLHRARAGTFHVLCTSKFSCAAFLVNKCLVSVCEKS